MAESVEAPEGADKQRKPGKGHNRAQLKKLLAPFVPEIFDAYQKMEEVHGSHVMKINRRFDKIAEETGFPKAMIRSEISRARRRMKEEQKEKEMDDELREENEALREAFQGTAFGSYFEGLLAKP